MPGSPRYSTRNLAKRRCARAVFDLPRVVREPTPAFRRNRGAPKALTRDSPCHVFFRFAVGDSLPSLLNSALVRSVTGNSRAVSPDFNQVYQEFQVEFQVERNIRIQFPREGIRSSDQGGAPQAAPSAAFEGRAAADDSARERWPAGGRGSAFVQAFRAARDAALPAERPRQL